jgi:hypothetical protein
MQRMGIKCTQSLGTRVQIKSAFVHSRVAAAAADAGRARVIFVRDSVAQCVCIVHSTQPE